MTKAFLAVLVEERDQLEKALRDRQERGHAYVCKAIRTDLRKRVRPPCDCGYSKAEKLLGEINKARGME